jgi:hypothetical protein
MSFVIGERVLGGYGGPRALSSKSLLAVWGPIRIRDHNYENYELSEERFGCVRRSREVNITFCI